MLSGPGAGLLKRRAQREAQRVDLEVKDGHVSVSGVVHSWGEREAVIDAVKATPGVSSVDPHLRIDPHRA